MAEDRFNLNRFVAEQEKTYLTAYQEVSKGKKRSHWMWWIFPQIIGLGMTYTSKQFAIRSLEEAKAYFAHEYLGKNLKEISELLLTLEIDDPHLIFGSPDDLKLRSCMTLFAEAVPEEEVFQNVLDKFYDGKKDGKTLVILERLKEKP